MTGEFETYKERKGMWFWMMLSIAEVVSNEPKFSAKNSDHLVKDWLASDFFKVLFPEESFNPYARYTGSHG